MNRVLFTFALVFVTAIVLGRWYAYRQLLAERRTDGAQREAVERALAKLISTAEFAGEEKTREEVLRALARRCDVPLRVDRAAMRGGNKTGAASIYVPSGHEALGELLDRLSQSASLGWCRDRDRILVTSIANADNGNAPYTQVYRLPAGMNTGAKICDDAEVLYNQISCLLEPDSWDEVGGSGVIRPAGGAIVVHHGPDMHRRVAGLLRNLSSPPARRSFPLEYEVAPDEERILQALERIDSIDFHDEPLERVAKTLGERHKIPIVLHTRNLTDAGITPDTPITKKLSRVSLRTILREMLADLKLTYVIRNHVLEISAPEDAESQLVHLLYDVHDLAGPGSLGRFEDLIDLITTTVEPDSWDKVGGPGTIGVLGDRWLVVAQTQGVLEQVEYLLNHAREVLNSSGPDQVLLNPRDWTSPALDQALDRQVKLSYNETPLIQVCDQLTELLGIPVLLRKTQLEDVSVTADTPITFDLPPLPLRHALELILHDLKLAFRITGEVMEITTEDDAESSLDNRLLDVRHLTAPGAGGIDERSLKHLIESGIRPDSWEDAGGPGALSFFRGLMCVVQTDEVQQEVRHLINVLTEHLLMPPTDGQPQPIWLGSSTGEEQILARLQERESLRVVDPNVEELVRTLCGRHSIPVLIRPSYRDNADDAPLADFAINFQDAPLHEILTKLLKEKGGGFVTWNGVLFVTDEETAESQLRGRMYPVGPRWAGENKHSGQELARLLRDRVEPDSWDEVGGPGYTQTVNGQWLLVVQTLDVHRQIEEAIARLRAGDILTEPR